MSVAVLHTCKVCYLERERPPQNPGIPYGIDYQIPENVCEQSNHPLLLSVAIPVQPAPSRMQTLRVTCRAAAVGVLGLLWVVTAVFTCPERCYCDSKGWVFCSRRGLTDVPANIPSDTTDIFLSYNNIQSLSHADFSNLTSLRSLFLSNNNISSLPAGVFSHLTRLFELYLSNNHIADLPDGVFSHLTSLEHLDLSNNNISSLPAGIFSHLTRLLTLYLSNNHIADLPAGVFSHLTRLEELYLSDNHITDLPDGVFSNLTSLESLSLSNNNISSLPAGVFSHLTRLFVLDLSDNHIADLPDGVFSILTSLQYLDLSNNKISSLPAGVFSHLTRLVDLHLSNNHIADLPDGVFSNLTSLESLSLSNNNISSLPAGVFSHLTRLWRLELSNNHIADLPDGVFSHLTRLERLYLYNNHIANLPDGVFSNLTNLEYLDLDNNNMSSLPTGVFSHLTRLFVLDLSDNHIADLPDGVFSNLTSLVWLYLSNNNISSLPADIKHLSTQTTLYITGNPWRCDCSLQDIMTSVRGSIRVSPTCSSPPHMEDDALTDLASGRICNGRGVCPTGSTEGTCACDVGWTGPYCGEELNIALGKNATQSSTDAWNGAEKAVDGDYNECATTDLSSPLWQVDLAGFYRVSRVSVQSFSFGVGRVRVGPNENSAQNDQCGKTFQFDPTRTELRIANCEQPLFGRYVSIAGLIVRLCEVEVYVTDICCDDTIKLKNGQVTATDGYCSKSDIQFSCDTGYELVGNPATCQKNGSWDRQFPTCQRTCCDNTTRIKNGQIRVDNDYCYGNSIHFSCDTGYELVGSSFASCRDKNWDREIPTCRQESRTSTEAIIGGTSAGIAALLIVAAVVFTVAKPFRRYPTSKLARALLASPRRRLEEMVPLVPARPQFPKLETDPGRVTLGEKIGSGAFGIVYRATLTRDDRTEDVVVKTLKGKGCSDVRTATLASVRTSERLIINMSDGEPNATAHMI
ncbi:Leucine-rich repeat-containing protein 15 [Branchiostoma belcheri]|nr:Leucine-rich repeat-containing protein 15 [Branchiostoma belcheri]